MSNVSFYLVRSGQTFGNLVGVGDFLTNILHEGDYFLAVCEEGKFQFKKKNFYLFPILDFYFLHADVDEPNNHRIFNCVEGKALGFKGEEFLPKNLICNQIFTSTSYSNKNTKNTTTTSTTENSTTTITMKTTTNDDTGKTNSYESWDCDYHHHSQ